MDKHHLSLSPCLLVAFFLSRSYAPTLSLLTLSACLPLTLTISAYFSSYKPVCEAKLRVRESARSSLGASSPSQTVGNQTTFDQGPHNVTDAWLEGALAIVQRRAPCSDGGPVSTSSTRWKDLRRRSNSGTTKLAKNDELLSRPTKYIKNSRSCNCSFWCNSILLQLDVHKMQ